MIERLQALGWFIREHVYRDPDTGIRMVFYAIWDNRNDDTGAYGDTPEQAWDAAVKLARECGLLKDDR